MEFCEKLQQLRKQKNMTQEELAEALYVSRTAISKWESGRGYPSIDSLKALAAFYAVSIDDLLSGDELIAVAEKNNMQNLLHIRDLVFGLLDCSLIIFFFLPFFGETINGVIYEISLPELRQAMWYIKIPYVVLVGLSIFWGAATLVLQTSHNSLWLRCKSKVSMLLSIVSALLFMLSMQPYAAAFTFMFVIIKGILLLKKP